MSIQITVPTPEIINGEQVIPIYELKLRKVDDCEGKAIYQSHAGTFLTKDAAMNHIKSLQNSLKKDPHRWASYLTDLNGNLVYDMYKRYLILK